MSWLKKVEDVEVIEELDYTGTGISKTDAYTVKITEAYVKDSADTTSDSKSLVVGCETEDGETVRTYFTLVGRDGKPYYKDKRSGALKQHIGLTIANTLFGIVLGKEIFDVEPTDVEYEIYNRETKAMEKEKGNGFPSLIGEFVGVTVQMIREIDGVDSKEYGTIEHFFDSETGLFYNEKESDKTKLDKWLKSAKEYKETVKAAPKSSFKKTEPKGEEAPARRGWGRK